MGVFLCLAQIRRARAYKRTYNTLFSAHAFFLTLSLQIQKKHPKLTANVLMCATRVFDKHITYSTNREKDKKVEMTIIIMLIIPLEMNSEKKDY